MVFQFNPENLTRTQIYQEQQNKVSEVLRFELVFNAMEEMAQQDDESLSGIYPYIAALEEILAYQDSVESTSWLDILLRRGKPVLLFVYGDRIVPVRLLQLVIKERVHDSQLKPIHATVSLRLRVLDEHDLRGNTQGIAFLAQYRNRRKDLASQLNVDTTIF